MAKVWEKDNGNKLNPIIEDYEVGADYLLDGMLWKYELAASAAHARMLHSINILTDKELSDVEAEIKRLYKEHGDTIKLEVSDEDIHSKLENMLTTKLGEVGKKIHTGRSRNDQVLVITRLFEKDSLIKIALKYIDFIRKLIEFAEKEGDKILPGYTHTKQAMLQTVKMWATAFVEAGIDNLFVLDNTIELIDANPLGTGSGFGVPVALDRVMTTELLGFGRIAENPAYAQNSRGKLEGIIIDSFWNIMHDYSRIASDLLLFNMDELGFLKTNNAITTGSSIMPQKRNLDVMELVRARTTAMLAYANTVKTVATGRITGYHRDLQETKEPLFKAINLIQTSIEAVTVVFDNIEFDEDAIKKSLTKGIFATDIAFKAVGDGMPFRDAYKLAATSIDGITIDDETIRESIDERVSLGSHITIDLSDYTSILDAVQDSLEEEAGLMEEKFKELIGS